MHSNDSSSPTILLLGRAGDICNIIPALYGEHLAGKRPTIVASAEFAPILDGISYAEVKRYSEGPHQLAHAISLCQGMGDLRVAQVDQNPDGNRVEPNFCMESYRLAGMKHHWKTVPLVFDKRDKDRECALVDKLIPSDAPFIAVAASGHSSPFANAGQLLAGLAARFKDYKILDLSGLMAEKPYDLIGVMDRAACLVTIDTLHLHLANAARCPTVALLADTNGSWYCSPPPMTAVGAFPYSRFHIDQIGDCIESSLQPKPNNVWAVVDKFGNEERHKVAGASHIKTFNGNLLVPDSYGRNAKSIGDPRPLPMLKEMLSHAIKFSRDGDVIIWTNDDVEVFDISKVAAHCMRFGACSLRRDPSHIGREMFAFRWDWIASRLYNFPDCAVASPWFDLAVAAWIRQQFGIVSTMKNLEIDFYPCEIPNESFFLHPDHQSGWLNSMEMPASKWNQRIFSKLIK